MSKYIPGNQKHLSLEDRIYIENELNKGTTLKDIARFLCKDPTTIAPLPTNTDATRVSQIENIVRNSPFPEIPSITVLSKTSASKIL